MSLWYVDHVGHRWTTQAVSFDSRDKAESHARQTCRDAMRTRVWDCTNSPIGRLVLTLNRDGREI